MAKLIGLNTWLNRTTNQFIKQISSGGMETRYPAETFHDAEGEPIGNINWIHAPNMSAVVGYTSKYWIITGDVVSLMPQEDMDALAAIELSASRDAIADEMDRTESYTKAFALIMLDQFNLANDTMKKILLAADNATSLASFKSDMALIAKPVQRTPAQLKSALRNTLDQ